MCECATHQPALISPLKQFITATIPYQYELLNVYKCFLVTVVTTNFTEDLDRERITINTASILMCVVIIMNLCTLGRSLRRLKYSGTFMKYINNIVAVEAYSYLEIRYMLTVSLMHTLHTHMHT